MANTLGAPAPQPPGRLLFVDWLRAWALLIMIETHVFNAFLDTQLRQAGWFSNLNFLNGLVAPSFLFVSGFVFLVAAQKRIEELRAFGKAFRGQVRRAGMIWLIGYAMHLPTYWIPALLAGLPREMWLRFYRVDVLHCIAVTWLFLLASLMAIRSERLQRAWFTVWIIALSGLAPLVYGVDFQQMFPTPLAGYFNDKTQSLFPIFPWSAFMIAGAALRAFVSAGQAPGPGTAIHDGPGGAGGGDDSGGQLSPSLEFPAGRRRGELEGRSPNLPAAAGNRAPAAVGLLAVRTVSLTASKRAPGRQPGVPLRLRRAPDADLRAFLGWSERVLQVGKTRGPAECAAASVVLAVLMVAGARGWGAFKRRRSLPR